MSNLNILISLSAYKEAKNIVKITEKIRDQFNEIKILIVNDFSGDNTEKLIKEKRDKNIIFLQRPKKLGLGTAHKLCLIYKLNNTILIIFVSKKLKVVRFIGLSGSGKSTLLKNLF